MHVVLSACASLRRSSSFALSSAADRGGVSQMCPRLPHPASPQRAGPGARRVRCGQGPCRARRGPPRAGRGAAGAGAGQRGVVQGGCCALSLVFSLGVVATRGWPKWQVGQGKPGGLCGATVCVVSCAGLEVYGPGQQDLTLAETTRHARVPAKQQGCQALGCGSNGACSHCRCAWQAGLHQ